VGESIVTSGNIRRIILEQSKRAHVGHIGSGLSVADIIAALYGGVLCIDDPDELIRRRCSAPNGIETLAKRCAPVVDGNNYCDSQGGVLQHLSPFRPITPEVSKRVTWNPFPSWCYRKNNWVQPSTQDDAFLSSRSTDHDSGAKDPFLQPLKEKTACLF